MRQLSITESRHISGGAGEILLGMAIMGVMVGGYVMVKNYFSSDAIDPSTCSTMYDTANTVITFENPISLYDSQGKEYPNVSSLTQTIFLPMTVC